MLPQTPAYFRLAFVRCGCLRLQAKPQSLHTALFGNFFPFFGQDSGNQKHSGLFYIARLLSILDINTYHFLKILS